MAGQLTLRPYQETAIHELRSGLARGELRQMLMAATGAGKTAIASSIMGSAYAKGKRACFVVDSLELVDQAYQRFVLDGMDVGIIQGDHYETDYGRQIQVATIQTLRSRWAKMPDSIRFNLLVIDEAHVLHQAHIDIMKEANVPVIGLSATPFRKGLGNHFSRLVIAATTADLTDQGYLKPARVFAPSVPDLKGVKTKSTGDWDDEALAEVMGENTLMGDIVGNWLTRGEYRQTLVFACNVAHSRALCDEFTRAGVPAAHVDCYMDQQERTEIINAYRAGGLRVLCNCAVLTKGFDAPETSCVVMARPTKSLMMHIQMLGRGLRVGGAADCLIFDHAGNCLRNGLPEDPLPTTLCDGTKKQNLDRKKQDKPEKLPKACPSCSYVKPVGVHKCPACGTEPASRDFVETKDGELTELKKGGKVKITPDEKADIYAELLGYAQLTGKNPGWAWHKCRAICGSAPRNTKQIGPKPPSQRVQGMITSLNIRWAKSQKKWSTA